MSDFDRPAAAPALCTSCQQVVPAELLKRRPRCPTCNGEVVLYDAPDLTAINGDQESYALANWNLPDSRSFTLPASGQYRCPRCAQMTMTFDVLGSFD